jgi:putative membrane protein
VEFSKLIPNKYLLSLIIAFVAVWVCAAIKPLHPHDWLLENLLVFIAVPLIVVSGHYFRLSNLSYTLITLFMMMHSVGSHYTYAEVPFGYTLQAWFGSNRNMYDRLVHFCFGFLLAYPVREVFLRLARAKGFWGYLLPLDLTLALSATYEIIEWVVAVRVDPSAGMAFLGTQGDVWDSQKDMLMAGVGAIITMVITAIINLWLNPSFWEEMRASFRVPMDDEPLGEVRLQELIEKDAKKKG